MLTISIFIVIIILAIVGLGIVGRLLTSDTTAHPADFIEVSPEEFEQGSRGADKNPPLTPSPIEEKAQGRAKTEGWFEKFTAKKKSLTRDMPSQKPKSAPLPNLKEVLAQQGPSPTIGSGGTASMRTQPPAETTEMPLEEKRQIEKEIELSLQLNEIKEKYAKTEKLLQEKNTELEKYQKTLEGEITAKKEFNKIKDILEKEIRDNKDRIREVHAEFNTARAEAEGQKKRSVQLEEKISRLEKDLLRREDEVDKLKIQLQKTAHPPEDGQGAAPGSDLPKMDSPETNTPAPSQTSNPPDPAAF